MYGRSWEEKGYAWRHILSGRTVRGRNGCEITLSSSKSTAAACCVLRRHRQRSEELQSCLCVRHRFPNPRDARARAPCFSRLQLSDLTSKAGNITFHEWQHAKLVRSDLYYESVISHSSMRCSSLCCPRPLHVRSWLHREASVLSRTWR